MELFLEVNTLLIDAAKSGIAEDQYDNPDELIYCFGEKNLIYSYLNPLFYHLDNCRSIFHYLDGIEQIIPKEEKTIYWRWGGVRQGCKYYISIFFKGTTDMQYDIESILYTVCGKQLCLIGEFSVPSIESDSNNNDKEWHQGKYDDDSHLRIVEECTFGKKWVQWERPYPEQEGCSMQTVINAISAISGFMTITDHIINLKERYYSYIISKLSRIVRKKTKYKGDILEPEPMPPRWRDGKTGRKEYLFYQVLDDGRERKIYISKDGKHIKLKPFSTIRDN